MDMREYAQYQYALSECPEGDYRTHLLIAHLIVVVSSALGVKGVDLYDIAPWLKTPSVQEFLEQKEEEERVAAVLEGANAA